MQFDILIPTTESVVAKDILDRVAQMYPSATDPFVKSMAKEIVDAKYWEAVDCECQHRQEYWRVVKNCLDVL